MRKFNSLIPELSVKSIEESKRFYIDILGFKLEYPFGRGINFEMKVPNVQEIRDNLVKNNIKLFRDITINEYESNGEIIVQEEFLVQDLNGYLLRFCMYK